MHTGFRSEEQSATNSARATFVESQATTITESPVLNDTVAAPTSGVRALWESVITHNPLYRKERHTQKVQREKRTPQARLTERLIGTAFGVCFYWGVAYLIQFISRTQTLPEDAQAAHQMLYAALLAVYGATVAFAPINLAAMSITQEREKQTWNALLLSRLTPVQVLGGKAAAALVPSLMAGAFLLPPLIGAAVAGHVPIGSFAASQAVIGVTTLLTTSLALFFSFIGRRTQNAVSTATAAGMSLLFATPLLTFSIYLVAALVSHFVGTAFEPDPAFGILALLPNVFNAGAALLCTLPQTIGIPDLARAAAPLVYSATAVAGSVALWKRMLRHFFQAPKDFGG
jgi:hypothetical protein